MATDRDAVARASYDFQERHRRGSASGAAPRGWDPDAAERERIPLVASEVGSVAFDRSLFPDEPHAETRFDAAWALAYFQMDKKWCADQPLFSAAILGLGGRTAPGIMELGSRGVPAAGAAPRRPARRRGAERNAPNDTAHFVGYKEVNLPLKKVRDNPKYPPLPPSFNDCYEVPFGLKVGTPLCLRHLDGR